MTAPTRPMPGAGDDPEVPTGYVRVRGAGGAEGVALAAAADGVRAAIASGTLHAWAGARPDRRELRGRGVAWAVALPGAGGDVVVRHAWHGGLLAPLTRDLFRPPTRAPHELATSRRLRALGIRTPEIVAWVRYPAGAGLVRVDVATRLVPGGHDLVLALRAPVLDAAGVRPWVRPTGALLHALGAANVRHPDLNLKNVLLTPSALPGAADDAFDAWVLDVDVARVPAGAPDPARARAVAAANLQRLERSLTKQEARLGYRLPDLELAHLRAYALRGPDARLEIVWRPGHNVGPT